MVAAEQVVAAAGAQPAPVSNPWFSWGYLQANGDRILDALTEHVALTGQAILFAAALGIPLAVLAYRVRPLTGPILASAGVLYTIPALAVFAFIAPYLGIGPRTVIVPLVLYALLVIIRNTLTGLLQVPVEVRDAARGMGYGRWAQLVRIELPLALPGILTGLRLATVATVAMTTIGVVVGHGGLGQLILGGFRNNFFKAEILTGAVLCVALALVLDLVLLAVGRAATPWARRRAAA
ncbi:ABC transporter permease [Natronosporangium hydrolyticum]|uniref:ABC transporter permease n=1 Tax=Natronosporangium hydrolyticum TaxID=2811111 RepID=A0A895YP94_9ACTN|nr:ABC transporter permease [Natronosporangium hydrolyticum]QSB17113.1 ABC transporter permease [Natronosporangium hydrolyticum]